MRGGDHDNPLTVQAVMTVTDETAHHDGLVSDDPLTDLLHRDNKGLPCP